MYTKLKKKNHTNLIETMRNESFKTKADKFYKANKRILVQLYEKHKSNSDTYNVKQINDIVYNEKANIVACFKDFLIFDDNSEFLKRYYKNKESEERLPRLFDYYENYSKIFPNYIILIEAKYIYKNIQKKQRLIDTQQLIEAEGLKKKDNNSSYIFDTKINDSIMNQSTSFVLQSFNLDFNHFNVKSNKDKINSSIENLIETICKIEEKGYVPSLKAKPVLLVGHKNALHIKKNSINLNTSTINNHNSQSNRNNNTSDKTPIIYETKVISQKFKSISQSSNFNKYNVSSETPYSNKASKQITGKSLKDSQKPVSAINTNIMSNLFPNFSIKSKVNSIKISSSNLQEPKVQIIPSTTNNKAKTIMHMKNPSLPVNPSSQTGNIYYIINQNENGNTHINIFSNNDKLTSSSSIKTSKKSTKNKESTEDNKQTPKEEPQKKINQFSTITATSSNMSNKLNTITASSNQNFKNFIITNSNINQNIKKQAPLTGKSPSFNFNITNKITQDNLTNANDEKKEGLIYIKSKNYSQEKIILNNHNAYSKHKTIDVESEDYKNIDFKLNTINSNSKNNFTSTFNKKSDSNAFSTKKVTSFSNIINRENLQTTKNKILTIKPHISNIQQSPFNNLKSIQIEDIMKKYTHHKQSSLSSLNSIDANKEKKFYVKSKIFK